MQEEITGIDNDTWQIDRVRLGAVSGIDSGTSGTYFFDAFESRQSTYIGEQASLPVYKLAKSLLKSEFSKAAAPRNLIAWLRDLFSFTTANIEHSPIVYRPLQDQVNELAILEDTITEVITITYSYDSLYRLIAADYSDGSYYHYLYDAVGNREVMTTTGEVVTDYVYDEANRLTNVDEVDYTWDGRGNLLNDGVYTYTYSTDNRLILISNPQSTIENRYNGLGDRLQQTVDSENTNYSLDQASSLTQVLSDGTNTYLYGVGRIAQESTSGEQYFLADALGSVRQLVDASGSVQTAKSFEPYGEVLSSLGDGTSNYGFTGEWTEHSVELVNLRSRIYSPGTGRFLTRDSWRGDYTRPLSLNGWNYVEANPVNRIDPSGKWYCQSGFVPLTGECRSWVKNALEELDNSGTTGKRLVNFFHTRDQIAQLVNDLVCPPLPMLNGIKIYFEPLITGELGAQAFTIWPDQIHINSGLSGFSGMTPSKQAVVTFGHEISHLAQDGFLPSLSVQAEVLATIVGYYLEGDLGSDHRDDGVFIISNRLDPWLTTDLAIYDDYYVRVYGKKLPYLYWGTNGVSRNWLIYWGITLPYQTSDSKPRPDPVPTPPPPTSPPTPVPPGF